MKAPQEILSRLFDAGYMEESTIPKARIIEECKYVCSLLDEGGSTYDDDTPQFRRELRASCEKYLKANTKSC
jgi:hypothetical protein